MHFLSSHLSPIHATCYANKHTTVFRVIVGFCDGQKVALGQVFSQNFGFPCQSTFHLLLPNHLHYHPGLAQLARSGRIADSLSNQIKKK
jgi:hypothetical protein